MPRSKRRRGRIFPLHAVSAFLLLAVTFGCGGDVGFSEGPPKSTSKRPIVLFDTTMGRFTVELDTVHAPITTLNFLNYVKHDFYVGTIFHQVIRDSTVAGGSLDSKLKPKTDGLRPPIPSEWDNAIKNDRATIGMMRTAGKPDSATSGFYINLQANPNLDQPNDGAGYTVFGTVKSGMDTLDRIGSTQLAAEPSNPAGPLTVPIVPVIIRSAEVQGDFDMADLEKRAQDATQQSIVSEGERKLKQKAEIEKVIADTKTEYGVDFTTTPSGLMYATLRPGNGPMPSGPTTRVQVHYEGRLTNGKKFDSSYDRNAPATFGLNQVIKGWTEGVGSMKVGEKRRLIIPSDLGYGDRGAPPDIPGKATLVFDVELLSLP